jgi:hypothetical protein
MSFAILGAGFCFPCSLGLAGGGHGGEAVVGRGGGGPGVRRRQGIKGGLSREGQEKVELSFPGGGS